MSAITREFTKEQLIEHIKGRKEFADECAADSTLHPERREYYELTAEALRIAMASLEAEPVPEWTNKQCLEFLSIAFRHAEIKGDLEMDDIRMGVKMVNGSCAGMLQGAEPDFRQISNSSTKHFRENAETSTKCWCHTCRPVTFADSRFVVCPDCGNKRCPHANDHRHACTKSNEPGQEGSAYPAAPQQEE
ncbi:hypothetical protein [Enterobacter ludwigii]|uniref:hypothetical protein n=1 Tax=Enterobacter ludwigii TaxID=299767 RepID=UPI001D009ECB|nr:hypothetical protein [Enterobacter ludwigii]